MDGASRERALERLGALARRGFDLVTFWRECGEVLATAVAYHDSPCWFTLDPASLLVTSHYQHGVLEIPGEWLSQEYCEPDFNKMADIARSREGIATLHDATGGRPERSVRFLRDMVPHGVHQELLAGLRSRDGGAWGVLGLYRGKNSPLFNEDEQRFLRAASPHLAEGARRALLIAEAREPDCDDPPGLVVLDRRWEVVSITPYARRWLSDLPPSLDGRDLPPAIFAAAGAALGMSNQEWSSGGASSRVLGLSGAWIAIHASPIDRGDGEGQVAVIVERAGPARIAPLLMSAYGLTPREQEVTRLVLRGVSTEEMAETLTVTANTVQQHLKNIFEKTGVNSRRDLTAQLFLAHFEPRVRDNEKRTLAERAIRGGPHPLMPGANFGGAVGVPARRLNP